MSISVSEFVTKYSGQPVKSPHGILGQCVSVPSEFAVENGWPELYGPGDGTALEIYNNGISGYNKVGNVVGPNGNYPAPGDFVFFGSQYGGGDGHTGLVTTANLASVTLFEQNDPYGSTAHMKAYSYYDLLGWFHWPTVTPPTVTDTLIKSTVNVRYGPHVTSPVYTTLKAGASVYTVGTVMGDEGTVNGHTSSTWLVTEGGHYFNAGATM